MPGQSQYPRNVSVFDANVPQLTQPVLVGGMMQLGSTTGQEFYFCLQLCFSAPRNGQFTLLHDSGLVLPCDNTMVPIGNYFVVAQGSLSDYFVVNSQMIPLVIFPSPLHRKQLATGTFLEEAPQ